MRLTVGRRNGSYLSVLALVFGLLLVHPVAIGQEESESALQATTTSDETAAADVSGC